MLSIRRNEGDVLREPLAAARSVLERESNQRKVNMPMSKKIQPSYSPKPKRASIRQSEYTLDESPKPVTPSPKGEVLLMPGAKAKKRAAA